MTKIDTSNKLNDKQSLAISLIILGQNDSEVAGKVKVTRQTVNKWKNRFPEFIATLNATRLSLWDSQIERLRKLLPEAVSILQEELKDENPKVRRDAARFLLRGISLMPSGSTVAEVVQNKMEKELDETRSDGFLRTLGKVRFGNSDMEKRADKP